MRTALMLCLVLIVGASFALAQSASTPANPVEIIDPIRAWLKGDNGFVVVTVRVNRDGLVDRILKNSASDQLRPVYDHYCKQWKFQPALRDGQPVESVRTLRFQYTVTSTYSVVADP